MHLTEVAIITRQVSYMAPWDRRWLRVKVWLWALVASLKEVRAIKSKIRGEGKGGGFAPVSKIEKPNFA